MFLVIDNYDSFVHNLARYFSLSGVGTRVMRNDAITLEEIRSLDPEALILSPGPCTPKEAGICVEAIREFSSAIPILGVCLGHQCIGEAYGHEITQASEPMHGKASLVRHDAEGLFRDIPSPFFAGRYHSLIVKPQDGSPLKVIARDDEGQIMALAHEEFPVFGVQFHPESILTDYGLVLVKNFVSMAREWKSRRSLAA